MPSMPDAPREATTCTVACYMRVICSYYEGEGEGSRVSSPAALSRRMSPRVGPGRSWKRRGDHPATCHHAACRAATCHHAACRAATCQPAQELIRTRAAPPTPADRAFLYEASGHPGHNNTAARITAVGSCTSQSGILSSRATPSALSSSREARHSGSANAEPRRSLSAKSSADSAENSPSRPRRIEVAAATA